MSKTANDVLKLIKSKKIEFVDLRFCDIFGQWQHTSFPASEIDAGDRRDNSSNDPCSNLHTKCTRKELQYILIIKRNAFH